MKKRIMPHVCMVGLAVNSIPTNLIMSNALNSKQDIKNDDSIDKLDTNKVQEGNLAILEDVGSLESEDVKGDLKYVDILDLNLIQSLNYALNKDNLNSRITIDEMMSLSVLDLSNKDIESLNGLEYAINLTSLNLSGNNIVDVAPIAKLTNLTELNLSNNKINDVSTLGKLNKLKKLDLSNSFKVVSYVFNGDDESYNCIKDISALSSATSLEYLNLSNNIIDSVDCLTNLTNLKTLYLSGNSIGDISFLNKMSHLEGVTLSNQVIVKDKVSVVGDKYALDYFVLDENKNLVEPTIISKEGTYADGIVNWESLNQSVEDLEILFSKDIEMNNIVTHYSGKVVQLIEIDEIVEIKDTVLLNSINQKLNKNDLNSNVLKSEIETIEDLKIVDYNLKSLKGLEKAINLKELTIRNTQINNFEVLSNLTSLIKLDLMDNQLEDVSFLNNLKDLEYLNLQGNKISNINSIRHRLSFLKELNVSFNNLYTADLKGMNNLLKLDLSNNHIARLEGIEELPSLEELYLDNNNIGDISLLNKLESLYKLSVENQTVYLPVLNYNKRVFDIKNIVSNIDGALVSPTIISDDGTFEEDSVYWSELNEETEKLEFEFNTTVEKENMMLGYFSGKVVQPLEIDLFSTDGYLSLSLSTNQIKFENFAGIEDMEIKGAIKMNVDSSKTYDISVMVPTEIKNADGSATLNLNALSVKEDTSTTYTTFSAVNDKMLLLEDVASGVNTHSFDFKLNKDNFNQKDSYRAVVKFEINQK